jgi:hypothetical protein
LNFFLKPERSTGTVARTFWGVSLFTMMSAIQCLTLSLVRYFAALLSWGPNISAALEELFARDITISRTEDPGLH